MVDEGLAAVAGGTPKDLSDPHVVAAAMDSQIRRLRLRFPRLTLSVA